MEIQHVNVKLFLKDTAPADLGLLIPLFHGWIQDQVFEERLLDIADYRHVHEGPGVVLIGLEGNYSVDNANGRLGVRYNRKAGVGGSNKDRLKQASRAAITALQRIETDASVGDRFRFNGRDVEVFVNDRLLAPNSEDTRLAVEADLRSFFAGLFCGAEYSLNYDTSPVSLFGVAARTGQAFGLGQLLKNLAE